MTTYQEKNERHVSPRTVRYADAVSRGSVGPPGVT